MEFSTKRYRFKACVCLETMIRGHQKNRGVAQSGSAPALGAGGRRFKSSRPDQQYQYVRPGIFPAFLFGRYALAHYLRKTNRRDLTGFGGIQWDLGVAGYAVMSVCLVWWWCFNERMWGGLFDGFYKSEKWSETSSILLRFAHYLRNLERRASVGAGSLRSTECLGSQLLTITRFYVLLDSMMFLPHQVAKGLRYCFSSFQKDAWLQLYLIQLHEDVS